MNTIQVLAAITISAGFKGITQHDRTMQASNVVWDTFNKAVEELKKPLLAASEFNLADSRLISAKKDAIKWSHVGDVPFKKSKGTVVEMKDVYRISYRCTYGKGNAMYATCIEIDKASLHAAFGVPEQPKSFGDLARENPEQSGAINSFKEKVFAAIENERAKQ